MEVATLNNQQKHLLVLGYAERYGVLVETGLYNGGGVTTTAVGHPSALEVLWAIDPDPVNIASVCQRGVFGLLGSSADVLPRLLRSLDQPVCFWLDAHYATEGDDYLADHPCPLIPELEAILAWRWGAASTVLIDDLRLLGAPGWPTRDDLAALDLGERWRVEEADDILRLIPLTT